jgi:hypothetical protein
MGMLSLLYDRQGDCCRSPAEEKLTFRFRTVEEGREIRC